MSLVLGIVQSNNKGQILLNDDIHFQLSIKPLNCGLIINRSLKVTTPALLVTCSILRVYWAFWTLFGVCQSVCLGNPTLCRPCENLDYTCSRRWEMNTKFQSPFLRSSSLRNEGKNKCSWLWISSDRLTERWMALQAWFASGRKNHSFCVLFPQCNHDMPLGNDRPASHTSAVSS